MKLFKGIKIFDHSLYVKEYLRSKNLVGHNDIINGCLRFWQRGTSFSSIANNTYFADRFRYAKNGTMVHDVTKDTDIPSGLAGINSIKVDCTTADTTIDAGNYCGVTHAIEGYNFSAYKQNYGTLSFWVKATKTGTYCISFRNSGLDLSYVAEYAINTSDTWEYRAIPILFDYTGGTWDYTNGVGLRFFWVLACGTTFQTTTKDTWQTGNYLATANQVNACDNVANNFWLAGIKFERGEIATPFIPNDYGSELVRCQRYYEKSYNIDVNPGTATYDGNIALTTHAQVTNPTTSLLNFKVTKRTAPSITSWNPVTGATGSWRDEAGVNWTCAINQIGTSGARLYPSATIPANRHLHVHWTADAEL